MTSLKHFLLKLSIKSKTSIVCGTYRSLACDGKLLNPNLGRVAGGREYKSFPPVGFPLITQKGIKLYPWHFATFSNILLESHTIALSKGTFLEKKCQFFAQKC